MTQHGFARDREFRVVEASPARVVMRLSDDAASRAIYRSPSARTRPRGRGLDAHRHRSCREPRPRQPCPSARRPSRLPLAAGGQRREGGPCRRVRRRRGARGAVGGRRASRPPAPDPARMGGPCPCPKRSLPTMRWCCRTFRSRSVRYAALKPDGSEARALAFSWEGYPPRPLVEADRRTVPVHRAVAFDGEPRRLGREFTEKPGVVSLAPGESRTMTWRVTV